MILITGAHKAFALYKAIEDGVNHMWTVSAFQQHSQTVFVCDEDATQELRVKTVKYFKGNKGPFIYMAKRYFKIFTISADRISKCISSIQQKYIIHLFLLFFRNDACAQ